MIQIQGIDKSYRIGANRLQVLRGIDLNVESGEFVSIMGSSGSGKSTLLNILGLLDGYDAGEYRLAGEPVKNLSEAKAARLRSRLLGFVFQSFNLISFKTAAENVALPLYYQKISRRKRNKLAMEYLDRVGLKEWAGHLPTEMSGGQQQRVAIARSMITQPKVILADEPTGALDSSTSYEVMQTLKRIHEQGVTLVVVTHEADIAAMTERTIFLKDGVVESDAVNLQRVQHV